MGTTHEAADNSTEEGRKLNRRVEVTVLINQGLVSTGAGPSTTPATAAPQSTNDPATVGAKPPSK